MREPIASLPNELLVYIFDLAHLSSDALMKDWIGRLYLCRRWYHILVSMPRFWRDIYVSARAEWLELCLSRCAGMSVNVFFTGRFSMQSTIPLLKAHARAIRSVTYSVLRPCWISDVRKLCSMSFPTLQKLEVSLETQSERYADIKSSLNHFEHLRSLELWSCRVPVDTITCANLRSLKICHCVWSATFDEVLDFLRSATRVNELVLVDCFTAWREVPLRYAIVNPPHRPAITLLALRIIRLNEITPALASQLSAHLRIPYATHVDIRAYCHATRNPAMAWNMLPPDPAAFSPIFSSATAATIKLSQEQSEITAQTAKHHLSVQISNTHNFAGIDSSRGATTDAVDRLLDVLRGAPLSSLSVSVAGLGRVAQATWENVFCTFDSLEYLHLDGEQILHNVFSGLKAVSELGGGALPCPRLTSVKIKDVIDAFDDTPHDAIQKDTRCVILEALRLRAERGTRLAELRLTIGHRDLEGGPKLGRRFIEELMSLVDEVKYKASGW